VWLAVPQRVLSKVSNSSFQSNVKPAALGVPAAPAVPPELAPPELAPPELAPPELAPAPLVPAFPAVPAFPHSRHGVEFDASSQASVEQAQNPSRTRARRDMVVSMRAVVAQIFSLFADVAGVGWNATLTP
jgi:hypothetical protein